jgi:transposase InsO family protein
MRWRRNTSISCTRERSRSSETGENASGKNRRKKNLEDPPPSRRERIVAQQEARNWPLSMAAQILGIQTQSLKRWKKRREQVNEEPKKRGRPESVPAEARWRIRNCYQDHFGQWDSTVLREWAIREGIGTWAAGTISRVIADLKPKPEPKPKPRRYEISAPMVMWSEDGTKFKGGGKKRELLVLQDECARYKINWKLSESSANAAIVVSYLRKAFEKHGAPLVLKHDGDSIFHEECVRQLLDEFCVVDLTSPPSYPQYNGKKERSMRDIKGYERALRRNRVGDSLEERIGLTMTDLNDDRPRPVLGGMTAAEVFQQKRIRLPDRRRFKIEVETRQLELEAKAGSRKEIQAARRKAVIEVLSHYGLLIWGGNVSTYLRAQSGTN